MPFQAFAARVFGICESIRPSNSRPMSASPQASTSLQVSYSLQASNSFQMSYSPRNGQRAPIKKARWRAGLSIVWENSSLTHTQSQREIDESTRGMGDLSQPNQKQIWTPFQMTHIGPPGTGSPPKPPSDAVAIRAHALRRVKGKQRRRQSRVGAAAAGARLAERYIVSSRHVNEQPSLAELETLLHGVG